MTNTGSQTSTTSTAYGGYTSGQTSPGWVLGCFGDLLTYSANTLAQSVTITAPAT